MKHEIGHRHFTAGEECGRAREQSKRDQKSADQFKPRAGQHESLARAMTAGRKAENFLSAVAGEKKADNDSHDAVHCTRVAIEEVHGSEAAEMPDPGQAVTISR